MFMDFRRLAIIYVVAVSCVAANHPDEEAARRQLATRLMVPEPLPRLSAQSYDRLTPVAGITAERVSYRTAYGMRVPAIVYRPSGASIQQHPGLIIVNLPQHDKASRYASYGGILYARAGAVVLTYDPLGQYERNANRESGTAVQPPPELATKFRGVAVTDVLQAVTYLLSRKDVDPKHIAVLGFFDSAEPCALDARISVCVLAGQGKVEQDTALFTLNAQRGPTLILSDSETGLPELRQRTITEAGTEKTVFTYSTLAGGMHSPYFLGKTAALWLEDKLKFPNWTKKQIQHMPETPWEGMTALGENIPFVSREDLHALPEVVWQAEKDDYDYEGWLQRAGQPLH